MQAFGLSLASKNINTVLVVRGMLLLWKDQIFLVDWPLFLFEIVVVLANITVQHTILRFRHANAHSTQLARLVIPHES